MNAKILLEDFRDLKIRKIELLNQLGVNSINNIDEEVIVCNNHLINLLENYKNGKVSEEWILEWVNTVWFSDVYDYCDKYCNCIASIMNKLEQLDEGLQLIKSLIAKYIDFLKTNTVI